MRRLLVPLVPLLVLLAVPATRSCLHARRERPAGVDLHEPAVRAAEVQGRALHHALRRDGVADRPRRRATPGSAPRDAANQRVLVSFERSHRAAASGTCRRSPSTQREITKFHQAFPTVKEISVWNEVNRCQSSSRRVAGQPTLRLTEPSASRSYFKAVRKVFTGSARTRSSRLDILDEQNVNEDDQYAASRSCASPSPDPKIIGFHNYSDTNRFSTTRTQARARGLPRQGVADRDRRHRQARPLVPAQHEPRGEGARAACSPSPSRTRRIQRLYVYQFNRRDPCERRLRRRPDQPGRLEAPRLRRSSRAARRAAATSRTLRRQCPPSAATTASRPTARSARARARGAVHAAAPRRAPHRAR